MAPPRARRLARAAALLCALACATRARAQYDIDAGSADDSADLVSGRQRAYAGPDDPIANTADDARFQTHRYGIRGRTFKYTLPDLPAGTAQVTLGFAENYQPLCSAGARVFSVFANGDLVVENLDVFDAVGCRAAHFETFSVDLPDATTPLVLSFQKNGGSSDPYVASIVVETDGTTTNTTTTTNVPTTTTVDIITDPPSSTTLTAPVPSNGVLFDIDAGSAEDLDNLVTSNRPGKYSVSTLAIDGTDDDERFSSHRYGRRGTAFTYTFPNVPVTSLSVTLGFAEIWSRGCTPGRRVFSVVANGVKVVEALDVFVAAGCQTAYFETFVVELSAEESSLELQFIKDGGAGDPFVSSIIISENDGTITTTTTVSGTTTTTAANPVSVDIDAGSAAGDLDEAVSGSSNKIQGPNVAIAGTQDDARYRTYRRGPQFSYTLSVPQGVYDLTLGFAELVTANCANSSRVFSVLVNGDANEMLTSIDVFKDAAGCNTVLERTVRVKVEDELVIEFIAVKKNAIVSSINVAVIPSCPVIVGGNQGEDHRAHAVPGTYPAQVNANSPKSYIDFDGDGFESVTVDGFKSHTHFQDDSDPDNPVSGSITEYKWTNLETEEVVSTSGRFDADFPLGTTRLLLEVVDSTCDSSEAETTVTVTGVISPGAYCYYYDSSEPLIGGALATETVKPLYATEYIGDFSGDLPEPPSFAQSQYSARCHFFYEVDADSEVTTLSVSTAGSGSAEIFKGADLVLDTTLTPSAGVPMAVGLTEFEVLFVRSGTSGVPQLTMNVNGTAIPSGKISYDRSTVVPVLESITPDASGMAGGVDVRVTGFGFFTRPILSFGAGNDVQASASGLSTTALTVTTPASSEGSVKVTARASQDGVASNALDFVFDDGTPPPVKFSREIVKEQDGSNAKSQTATCIALHGDSWYLGSLFGRVQKLTVDAQLTVTSRCQSPILSNDALLAPSGEPARCDVLGIAFAPSDTIGKPYVSVQTLYWFYRDEVVSTDDTAWRNGRIERLRPGGGCLEIEERVVSGLPVSDHDHGVNGLTFDNNGDLYAAVGGSTNAGLASDKFGDAWETPLSAAILKIKLSLGASFDGQVSYDREYDDHRNAQQTGGDVETFATGLRNAFDITFTSQGEIYGTDNGPNANFGRLSTECGQNATDGVRDRSPRTRPDKIYHATPGAWFGHPNLNRGECQYIDPFTDLDVRNPAQAPLPSLNYVDELHTVPSSVNGIIEYTAAHFGSALKGEIIATTYAPQNVAIVHRMKIGGQLQDLDAQWGALSVAQGPWGELIMPRVEQNKIHVLMPDYPPPSSLSARVVTPFRGGSAGGLVVTVTGHGFGNGSPTVSIDGNPCPIVAGSVAEVPTRGSILKCTTPASTGGAQLVDVVVTVDGASSVLSEGFMYSL